MTRKLTFIHTADIHMGAPVRGFADLSPEWEAKLIESIPASYDRVIAAALSRSVDFVIIAGDIFDTAHASYGDYLRFIDGLNRLDSAGIPSYLIAGNHDPFAVWGESLELLPPSAHFIGGETPEFELFERDGEPLCLIGARGYRNQTWPLEEPISDGIDRHAAVEALRLTHPDAQSAPFAVGIIHTGLDLDQSKVYSNPEKLLHSDVDYWACGHLHKRYVLPSEENPRIVFPGCIQGRDLKESESRGCFFVTLEEQGGASKPTVSLEFLPTASVVFHTIKVDVSPCKTLSDASQLLQSSLFHENGHDHCENMVVRIILEGQTDLHGFLVQQHVLESMRKRLNDAYPTFYCDMLLDRTAPKRDRELAKREGLFSAHVLGVADQQRTAADEMVNYIQSEFVKRGIVVPASLPRRISDFEGMAETLVLDLLEEESE
ncbi:MAG: DNA repair exonuclease [Eggerthellaceae bacterium]|nr:DNA repair exonuclease [Eggerthellaceae bacterium]